MQELNDSKHILFSELIFLETLKLNNNDLTTIHHYQFSNLSELVVLNLSRNKIQNILENTFSGLKSLVRLDLSSNDIKTIHSDAFLNTEALEMLDLGNNRLSCVCSTHPSFLRNVQHLQELYLQNNTIKTINRECFENLRRLHVLNVSGNALTYLNYADSYQLNLILNKGDHVSQNRDITTSTSSLRITHNVIKVSDTFSTVEEVTENAKENPNVTVTRGDILWTICTAATTVILVVLTGGVILLLCRLKNIKQQNQNNEMYFKNILVREKPKKEPYVKKSSSSSDSDVQLKGSGYYQESNMDAFQTAIFAERQHYGQSISGSDPNNIYEEIMDTAQNHHSAVSKNNPAYTGLYMYLLCQGRS